MKSTLNLAKRVILIFFRDKSNVFFSLLGSIIMLMLYMLFLGSAWTNSETQAIMPGYIQMQNQWLMAGIVYITCFSTSINAMGQLPYDYQGRISDDLNVTPIARGKIVTGYVIGAFVCSAVMTILTILFTYGYLLVKSFDLPSVGQTFLVLLAALLCIIMNCAFGFLLASLTSSPRSFGSVGSVLLTLIGFLIGVYVPIGAMGKTTQAVMTLLPFSHGASLLRLPFTHETLALATTPQSQPILQGVREFLGIDLVINSFKIQPWMSVLYMLVLSLVLITISSMRISKSRKV
ncbi:MAG: ABC transporter permease [Anaerolineaceae bacterium]